MSIKIINNLKNVLVISALVVFLASCGSGNGELTGVQDREEWYQDDPYGMLFIPMGSFNMGASDQDVLYGQANPSKTVSVQAFYMDETEITNNEYRQFVNWVRDSIAHVILGELGDEEVFGNHLKRNKDGDPFEVMEQGQIHNPINWDEEIQYDDMDDSEYESTVTLLENEGFYIPDEIPGTNRSPRYYHIRQVDVTKLMFSYYWIDFKKAALRSSRTNGHFSRMEERVNFIKYRSDNVYPDTLCWVHDFAYSYNEPMTQNYFWHQAYDHYPVVGVSWIQARAFSIWRTGMKRSHHQKHGATFWNDFRLPTEGEWEYASRGGLELNPFPWGGPYIRNSNGCFLANFKPLRGNYVDDGGFHTLIVGHYAPNDYGLYDMSGNVAEWCDDSFEESAYRFAHDMNMSLSRSVMENGFDDELTPALKRRVIRGGSWKDVGYYTRTSARTYEYQDTAKAYIGFRNVQTYLGRAKGDGPNSSNVYQ
ncbi:MAG: SUMF1/EgtB/PvdO family nonheme iron enzyme [Bacteroidales bacterium]|nr:SUMF1/EgtB/PvdO family nonheme iron enzyme [Bacteroidales bacterium]